MRSLLHKGLPVVVALLPVVCPALPVPIVFVSRQPLPQGSIYWNVPKGMPGVGSYSRFASAGPGKLVVLEANGSTRTLIDGSAPGSSTLNIVDVNAPDVSWDGTTIVFAGYTTGPSAWRLYKVGVDGSGLAAVTTTDQNLNYSQFGAAAGGLGGYGDTDPCWLPDGRIVFSSTRWPAFSHYSGVRTTNLHVVGADGSNLHRITAERNGADRPLVDPVTGKIVFSRWWRNHRFAINSMATVTDPGGGYRQRDGLSAERGNQLGGADFLWRNAWQAATINPDGTGLGMWSGSSRGEESNHIYGGGFTDDGVLIANFFPMYNMTEAAGFGGLRRLQRGAGAYEPVAGITYLTLDYVNPSGPTSYGIFNGTYFTEPEPLPDGRLLVSWAADVQQDYGLYTINADGSNRTLVYDAVGTTELRARAIRVRSVPPVIADSTTNTPSLLPPTAAGPYDGDGTFVFDARNVYFNAPVDVEIVSAPPIGSADRIRFFLDHQRTSPGSFPNQDWPILLGEKAISPEGAVVEPAPANVPLFEQVRNNEDDTVPFTGVPGRSGAAHVTGMNYGRPGTVASCVGCHAGHTMIPLPATHEAAKWTNLAPGAFVSVSSTRDANQDSNVVDRRVLKGEIWRNWTSASGQTSGQWVRLAFRVPIVVRGVRLYNTRGGGEANSTIQVNGATVRLYSDEAATQQVATSTTGPLSVAGTDVLFDEVEARAVRVEINAVSGTFYGMNVASLGEIEVIARGGTKQAASGIDGWMLY